MRGVILALTLTSDASSGLGRGCFTCCRLQQSRRWDSGGVTVVVTRWEYETRAFSQ